MISSRTARRRTSEYVNRLNDTIRQNTVNENSNVSNNTRSEHLEINFDNQDSETGLDYSEASSDGELSLSSYKSDSIVDSINVSLSPQIAEWCVKNNVSQIATSELLKILKPYHNELPLDARTLLSTPRNLFTEGMDSGEIYYFGVASSLIKLVNCGLTSFKFPCDAKYTSSKMLLTITVSTDGLPLSRSSQVSFWPILGILDQAIIRKPFLISIYCGKTKPSNVNQFFEKFVNEMMELSSTGIKINGLDYLVRISCIVADAPARSFLKCSVQFNAYFGCEKCQEKGRWLGRVVFEGVKASLRTDATYRLQLNPEHHHGTSPLLSLDYLGLVSQIPLDYMHLICLGVMRKFMNIWVRGKIPHRLSAGQIKLISSHLEKLKRFVPTEFSRKPRSLRDLDHYKATEFRLFLLFTGPVVLKAILPVEKYKHFMYFHTAIFILTTDIASGSTWNKYADNLLRLFVSLVPKLYSTEMLVFNVHSLIHLAADCLNYGKLDDFSAFPFENFMHSLKRKVRGQKFELKQLVGRMTVEEVILNKNGVQRPNVIVNNRFISTNPDKPKKYIYNGILISSDLSNCYFLRNSRIIRITDIIQTHSGIVNVQFQEFSEYTSCSGYPLDSSKIGIFKVKYEFGVSMVANISEISQKYVVLPSNDNAQYVCVPYSQPL